MGAHVFKGEVPGRDCANSNKESGVHKKAIVFCDDCAKFFCDTCHSHHKVFDDYSEHKLRPAGEVNSRDIQEAMSGRRAPRCDQHQAKLLDMFCDTCCIPVCSKCCLLAHKQHDYREFVEKAKQSRLHLSGLVGRADNLCNTLEKHLRQLELSRENIIKDSEEVGRQVRETANELRAAITLHEHSLLNEIKSTEKAGMDTVRIANKETKQRKEDLQRLRSEIKSTKQLSDVTDQIIKTPGLQERLHQQESAPLEPVAWAMTLERDGPSQTSTVLKAMLGNILVIKTGLGPALNEKLKATDEPQQVGFTLGQPLLTLKPEVGHEVSGLAVIDDSVCVTSWCQPYLWIHNIKTGRSKQHTLPNLKAVGLTSVPSNANGTSTLVIADSCKKLHFITISQQNVTITQHTMKDIIFEPRHVRVNSTTSKLVVANHTDNQIVICDITGDVEERLTVKTSLELMCCAVAIDNGYIVLDYSTTGRVHWVNRHGDVTHTYGQRDGECLYNPWDMALDSQGRLVLADTHNHRLHLVDVNRRSLHYLLTEKDGIKHPKSVCLDETTGRLFVGHWNLNKVNAISVYKW